MEGEEGEEGRDRVGVLAQPCEGERRDAFPYDGGCENTQTHTPRTWSAGPLYTGWPSDSSTCGCGVCGVRSTCARHAVGG